MKILVTGADGMLGSNLVRLLLGKGYEVKVFLHPSSKSDTLDGLNIERFYGDILDPLSLNQPFSGIDAVVHAAASTSVWPARSEKVRRINIEGTQNIIEKVLKCKVKRLVYVGSASSVNTKESGNSKYAFPGAKFRLDYIDSKYEAFNRVMDAVKNRNLPAVAILPTFMIGSYDSLPGSGKMILAIAQEKLKFYTKGGRNFIHVADVAEAIANSLELPCLGKYYVAGGANLSYREFFGMVASVTGKPAPRIRIPGWVVKSVGWFGTLVGNISGKEPLLSYPMARISIEEQFVASDEIVRDLGMPQTPVEKAIADCYGWFRANGYC
jgi:dihydroflavonol-4-reductase